MFRSVISLDQISSNYKILDYLNSSKNVKIFSKKLKKEHTDNKII